MSHSDEHGKAQPDVSIPVRTRLPAIIVDIMWLKSDRKMTSIQVMGFTLFNLIFIGFGLSLLQGTVVEISNGDAIGIFMMVFGLIPFILGLRGLFNTFRSL